MRPSLMAWVLIPGLEVYISDKGETKYLDSYGELRDKGQYVHSVNGYPYIRVTFDGKTKSFMVRRLVLLAFHGPPDDPKHVAANINGNLLDNRIENLEWRKRRYTPRPDYEITTRDRSKKSIGARKGRDVKETQRSAD